jgi:hypothetical protein
MSTSNVSERVADAKGLAAVLRGRSVAWLSSKGWLELPPPAAVKASRRPSWQAGMVCFASGVAVATVAGYLLDAERGGLRRRMAHDRTLAAIRDAVDWCGGKARHLRHRAQGTVAEVRVVSEQPAQASAP